jgi:hypothetical protein
MNGLHGILLMATGFLHVVFALMPVAYQKDWTEFWKKRLWNQVLINDDRKMAAFWFLIAGPLFFIIGHLIYTIEVQGLPLPISVGWMLFAVGTLGATMSHKSGFTVLILPQAIYYLLSAY